MLRAASNCAAVFGSTEKPLRFTASVCTLMGKFAWFVGRIASRYWELLFQRLIDPQRRLRFTSANIRGLEDRV
jgi:hypothetical protein